MTSEQIRKLSILSRQLNENLMSAALCAREINEIAHTGNHDNRGHGPSANGVVRGRHARIGRLVHETNHQERPWLDESTLSVFWKGKKLHLGHTRCFWLLSHLARRCGQYVTHLDLLRDVWDDEELATATVRSLVRRLRSKLIRGGMGELATAIQGHNGRYILNL